MQDVRCRNGGALLPVVAILIVAFSSALLIFTQLYNQKLKLSNFEETKKRMEIIAEALDNHVHHSQLGHGDLPCAAPLNLRPGDPGFAVESDACTWGAPTCGRVVQALSVDVASLIRENPSEFSGLPKSNLIVELLREADFISSAFAMGTFIVPSLDDPSPFHCGPNPPDLCNGDLCVWIGSVPTRTLNISDSAMYDAWGNRFTYAVTAVLAAGGTNYDISKGQITVKDRAGATVTSRAQYVIISHGPDGKGAYTAAGTTAGPCVSGNIDGENCDYTYPFPPPPYRTDKTFVDSGVDVLDPDQVEIGDFILWK